MLFTLPVSIGEGIDKLTILDIKLSNIKDESKRLEVKKEYDTLIKSLETYILKCERHYKLLKKINLDIWNLEDEIRTELSDERCAVVAKKIVYENDSRFRVKDKINKMCASELKEQKGYLVKTIANIHIKENNENLIDFILEHSVRNDKVEVRFEPNVNRQEIIEYFQYDNMITFTPKFKDAILLSHIGLGDSILSIGMMNYLSNLYDKLYVVCKTKYLDNIKLLINNPKIELYPVNEEKDISPVFGYDLNKFIELSKTWDIYLCGNHNLFKKNNHSVNNFPLELYDDIGVSRKVFWDFHVVNEPTESKELYNLVSDIEYTVIHNTSSTGKVFNSKEIIKTYGNPDNLIINFSDNEYEPTHKYYEIAQKFVNKPLAYYRDVIANAKYIFLADSSIFSMSLFLPIKTDNCYYIPRSNFPYEQIYDEKIFDKTKYKQFKRLN
jgi:hypothetical protein